MQFSNVTESSFFVAGLQAGTVYTVSGGGETQLVTTASPPPPPVDPVPHGLRLTSATTGSMVIDADPVDGADAYRLHHPIPGASSTDPWASVESASPHWDLDGFPANLGTPCYATSVIGGVESGPSEQLIAWTKITKPIISTLTATAHSVAVDFDQSAGMPSVQGRFVVSVRHAETGAVLAEPQNNVIITGLPQNTPLVVETWIVESFNPWLRSESDFAEVHTLDEV